LIGFLKEATGAALVDVTPQIPKPTKRCYDGIDGEALAVARNLMAIIRATAYKFEDPSRPVILDRWILSAWVYSRLRGLPSELVYTPRTLESLFLAYAQAQSHATAAFWQQRAVQIENFDQQFAQLPLMKIHWILLIPTVEEVEARRARCGKLYPFETSREEAFYMLAASYLQKHTELLDVITNNGETDALLRRLSLAHRGCPWERSIESDVCFGGDGPEPQAPKRSEERAIWGEQLSSPTPDPKPLQPRGRDLRHQLSKDPNRVRNSSDLDDGGPVLSGTH